MDPVYICPATSTRDNKLRVNKTNRVWRKRLHRRKTAVQPPTMQSEDKNGPKKIPEEWEQSTVWPSSKKLPQEAQPSHHRTNDSRCTLRFTCSQCKDNLEYVPKDLVRHFEESHRGSQPAFPCHVCTFNTHEFSLLQVHLLSHKDTFSSCSICNDNVKRTWSEFCAHLTMYHCQNGRYSCEMCQKFSTGDVGMFLEHIYVHHFGPEGASDNLLLSSKDSNQFGSIITTQILCCQHCGYEASQKWLLAKHINTNHVSQNSNQKKRKVNTKAMKPNDPIPKIKPRLTRSAVREMCWLTQDCLSLPGREFLDKYCHLSDPQTTLEETQQFLMKSVAGETGDQKWTKALKTVLSNVPQDKNLHPKSENGIMSNSADLTVLTVKNKITVAQNGATYAKRLKMMAPTEKDALPPESAAGEVHCLTDQNGCQSNLNDYIHCPQTEPKLNNDASMSGQNDPSVCIQMLENRENQELTTDRDTEEHAEPKGTCPQEDGVDISSEVTVTTESQEHMPPHKVPPKNKRRTRRRIRKTRSKKTDQMASVLGLKIVLKKNPVKEKQWVSQSSLSPSGSGPIDGQHRLANPDTTTENTGQVFTNALPTDQRTQTKACKSDQHDPTEAITPTSQSQSGEELTPHCAAEATGSNSMVGRKPVKLEGLLLRNQEKSKDPEESLELLEIEVDERIQSSLMAAAVIATEVRSPQGDLDCHVSATDGVTPLSSCTRSSPAPELAIAPLGETNSGDLSLALSLDQSDKGIRDREVPADALPDLLSNSDLPAEKSIRPEPSPASLRHWQPVPKNRERTLKLIAINPSQLIKRPVRDQPVVVLNHPDADIPEVARIMEVINRYRGEVQKVMLSRRTLNALSAETGGVPETNEQIDTQTHSPRRGKNSVQERFVLKLRLRRLSRKKYEVVDAVSPSRDVATKFRCWFCGRIFECQEMWMVHRQRHLMDWNRPNCEN